VQSKTKGTIVTRVHRGDCSHPLEGKANPQAEIAGFMTWECGKCLGL
jgi:hypothetical protein